jgi:nitrite reductase/ring-hydroxylating ferredoxin subunit
MTDKKTKQQFAVGGADEFPVGRFKIVQVDGREIGIARLANGEFRAVRNVCPHKGAPVCRGFISGTSLPCAPGELVYGNDGAVLVCPWHGYEFDLNTGALLYQEDPSRLLMYPAQLQDGKVVVTI